MIVKFDKPTARGVTDAHGSCCRFVDYLCSEDEKRIKDGLVSYPFFDIDGNLYNAEEVVSIIDRNNKRLGSKRAHFYSLVIAPSSDESSAFGVSEDELVSNSLPYLKGISKEYQSVYSEQLNESVLIPMFWKPHFTRGKKEGVQFHWHCIISRCSLPDDSGRFHKCSPLTNHSHGTGTVSIGFSRKDFCAKCEKIFDEQYGYKRQAKDSFAVANVLKHGNIESREGAAELLASEIFAPYKDGISKYALKMKARRDSSGISGTESTLKVENTTPKTTPKDENSTPNTTQKDENSTPNTTQKGGDTTQKTTQKKDSSFRRLMRKLFGWTLD